MESKRLGEKHCNKLKEEINGKKSKNKNKGTYIMEREHMIKAEKKRQKLLGDESILQTSKY